MVGSLPTSSMGRRVGERCSFPDRAVAGGGGGGLSVRPVLTVLCHSVTWCELAHTLPQRPTSAFEGTARDSQASASQQNRPSYLAELCSHTGLPV